MVQRVCKIIKSSAVHWCRYDHEMSFKNTVQPPTSRTYEHTSMECIDSYLAHTNTFSYAQGYCKCCILWHVYQIWSYSIPSLFILNLWKCAQRKYVTDDGQPVTCSHLKTLEFRRKTLAQLTLLVQLTNNAAKSKSFTKSLFDSFKLSRQIDKYAYIYLAVY